jgi:hypothetical protein
MDKWLNLLGIVITMALIIAPFIWAMIRVKRDKYERIPSGNLAWWAIIVLLFPSSLLWAINRWNASERGRTLREVTVGNDR